jgi:small-conductance mechanosensitive channel
VCPSGPFRSGRCGGVAVGFGAQSLIKDYFTGFFILVEDQIRQGDVVEAVARRDW